MDKDGSIYVIDANAFIDVGERFYPEDVFGCVWKPFRDKLRCAAAVTIKAVLGELERLHPLPPWRTDVINTCKPHAIDEAEERIQRIFARLSPDAQTGGKLPRGLSEVDLFVLSTGEALGAPIVTRDREIRLSCQGGLVHARALEPAEYFREMGWTFA